MTNWNGNHQQLNNLKIPACGRSTVGYGRKNCGLSTNKIRVNPPVRYKKKAAHRGGLSFYGIAAF
jgi:hypothetical protein